MKCRNVQEEVCADHKYQNVAIVSGSCEQAGAGALLSREDDMLTITAIIRVRKGEEAVMRQALLDVAAHVRANEPTTIGFYISQDASDPCVFTTYERFTDQAAMDRHNNSEVVAHFFGIAKPILDGEVKLVTCTEIFTK
jgi:quinol monooxygenase YgiN